MDIIGISTISQNHMSQELIFSDPPGCLPLVEYFHSAALSWQGSSQASQLLLRKGMVWYGIQIGPVFIY